jgi:hypothetical protein
VAADARCPNCGAEAIGAYCHACGQPQHVEHSIFSIFGKSASDALHLDHVLARTLVDLLRRPGGLISDVLRGRTRPYAKPIATLLLVASSVFLLMQWTGLSEAMRASCRRRRGAASTSWSARRCARSCCSGGST